MGTREDSRMTGQIIKKVHDVHPLIHCITNYVSMNDCANILLACGGAAIMAEDIHEVEEITSLCNGLTLNMGMLTEAKCESMILAGQRANALGHPVVLDPVGVGSSTFRREAGGKILQHVRCSIIRGNVSEIKTLAFGSKASQGVEADETDQITRENLEQSAVCARALAQRTGAVIVMTGAVDLVSDATTTYAVRNGHPMMRRVTGTGCQLSALTTAYVAANRENILEAAMTAVCAMGIAGETAYRRMDRQDGNASYRNYIIDAICHMEDAKIRQEGNVQKIES